MWLNLIRHHLSSISVLVIKRHKNTVSVLNTGQYLAKWLECYFLFVQGNLLACGMWEWEVMSYLCSGATGSNPFQALVWILINSAFSLNLDLICIIQNPKIEQDIETFRYYIQKQESATEHIKQFNLSWAAVSSRKVV